MCCILFSLIPLPYRNGVLSGGNINGAWSIIIIVWCFLAFICDLKTQKTELHFTLATCDVFTLFPSVLHQYTTGGAGPDGGTLSDSFNIFKNSKWTVAQCFQGIIAAAFIITAISPGLWTFPFPQTLPAELIGASFGCCAHLASDTQIWLVFPCHRVFTSRTLWIVGQ